VIVPLLCFVALAIVVAGCGNSSGNPPGSPGAVRSSVDALGVALAGLELAHTAGCCAPAELKSARQIYLTSAQDLNAALGPIASLIVTLQLPPEVRSAQTKLVGAVLGLEVQTQRVIDEIQDAKLSAFPKLASELDVTKSDAARRMQDALDELRAKGYDLGTLGTVG
jgi:hypothetical protein